MNKKNIAIIVCVVIVAIIVLLLILFGNKKYEVTFDSKGGSEVASQTVKAFGKATEPEDPTLEGYVFDAWYYEDEEFDFDTTIDKDMTLEARWIDDDGTFTVSFSTGGGSSVASMKVGEDGTIDEPSDPTRSGYKFVSWQLNGKTFDFDTKITESITLTAKWEKVSDDEDDEEVSQNTDDDKDTVKVTSVSLSKKSVTLDVGGKTKITATVKPSNATSKTVTWKSSNTAVATVDKSGNITAVGAGSATITATAGGKSATVKVTVTAPATQEPSTPSEPTEPTTPSQPEEPTPPVEEQVTYSYEWVAIPGDVNGDAYLYIKSSKGAYVSGTVKLTYLSGRSETVSVSASGTKLPKAIISTVTDINA